MHNTPCTLLTQSFGGRDPPSQALVPLAAALRYNDTFLAFKADQGYPRMTNPTFGGRLSLLAPIISTNSKLLSLKLTRLGGTPADFSQVGLALAKNRCSALSIIDFSDNHVGDDGAR